MRWLLHTDDTSSSSPNPNGLPPRWPSGPRTPLAVLMGLLAVAVSAMHTATQTSAGVQIAFTVLGTIMPFLVLFTLLRMDRRAGEVIAAKPIKKRSRGAKRKGAPPPDTTG